jgi:penicillin-binding protein 2
MERIRDKKHNPGYSNYTEQVFMTQIPMEDFAMFQEKNFMFKGFYIRKRYIRQYTYNVAGVLFGDVGEVSQKHLDNDSYYQKGDYIGIQGLESSYEKQLRGEKGTEVLLRDVHGRIQGKYNEGKLDTPAVRGKNLTLSLDIELQMLGERLMKNKLGSIVAIEPETGEILCMVSSPSYDPSLLTGRDRGQNHRMLSSDKSKPLLNRAIMELQQVMIHTLRSGDILTRLSATQIAMLLPLATESDFIGIAERIKRNFYLRHPAGCQLTFAARQLQAHSTPLDRVQNP